MNVSKLAAEQAAAKNAQANPKQKVEPAAAAAAGAQPTSESKVLLSKSVK